MEKNLDEIRSSINAFNKMVEAVSFAVSVAEKLKENQNIIDGHDVAMAVRKAELERVNGELAAAQDGKKKTSIEAVSLLNAAREEAAKIHADAKTAAENLIVEANKMVANITKEADTAKIHLSDIKSSIAITQSQLDAIKAEREKLAGSIEASLQKVKS